MENKKDKEKERVGKERGLVEGTSLREAGVELQWGIPPQAHGSHLTNERTHVHFGKKILVEKFSR